MQHAPDPAVPHDHARSAGAGSVLGAGDRHSGMALIDRSFARGWPHLSVSVSREIGRLDANPAYASLRDDRKFRAGLAAGFFGIGGGLLIAPGLMWPLRSEGHTS